MRHALVVSLLVMSPACNCGNPDSPDGGTGGSSGAGGSGGGTGGGATGGGSGAGGGSGGAMSCGWQRSINSVISDIAYDVAALPDQSIVVGGVVGLQVPDAGLTSPGGFAARFDADGTLTWSRSFGVGLTINRVFPASDGTVVLGGSATTDGGCADHHGAKDIWIARVNAMTGAELFRTCIGGDDDDVLHAMREVMLNGQPALHLTGSTDSHSSGDIGPKHGGGGFDAPDLLNAFLRETPTRTVTASAQGTLGPDEGSGFLDDGSIVGSTFGDNDGDLMGSTVVPGYADLFIARFPNAMPCAAQSCTVSATRISGNLGDSVSGAVAGDLVYGVTRSNDGGIACPLATQTTATPWVANWTASGLQGLFCATSTGNATVQDGFLSGDSLWVLGSGAGTDGVFADAGVIGTGMQIRTYLLEVAASDRAVRRVLRVRGDNFWGAALRPDGCLVMVGNDNGAARVFTTRP